MKSKPKEMQAEFLIRFGKRLRKIRLSCELTLGQAAIISGMSKSYISDCERGVRNPSLVSVTRFCKVYGISMALLFAEETGEIY